MAAAVSYIDSLSFCLSNDDTHREGSYVDINSPELYSTSGKPVSGGMYDLALGTTEHNYLCVTCSHGKKMCPGHRGKLELNNLAVVQPIAIAEVRKWLRTICLTCGEVLLEREKIMNIPLRRRLTEASNIDISGKSCPKCGAIHPKITKDDEDYFTFWAEPPVAVGEKRPPKALGKVAEKRGDKLYPNTLRAIFERVTDANCKLLGRTANTHPRNLVLRVINIPPTTIRPGVKSFTGTGNSNADSTNLLQHLAKRNMAMAQQKMLPDAMGPLGPSGVVDEELDKSVINFQQIYYDYIMGSSSTSATQGNAGKRGLVVGQRSVNSMMRSLPGKKGLPRHNITGKRVFYISRSTISGSMDLRIDEVGIPLAFARTLQVKEVVQEYNRDWLMTFFLNGRRQYPGCTHIVKYSTGEIHDVAGLKDFRLDVGDIIYRDVINGDYAFFNRAPSLERSSINVHKVVVIKDPGVYTFQMNVLACVGYNADFDGDAMVLWIAREPSSRAEAAIMSSISNCFISTKSSGPLNGQVQDSTIGSYELTRSGVIIDRYHAMALFAGVDGEPPKFNRAMYTGRDIISLLLEKIPISYHRQPTSYSAVYAPYITYDPEEIMTTIKHGKMLSGVLDKKAIGTGASGGIFHLISREYGPQRALDAIFDLQQIVLQFLIWRGGTISTTDLLPSAEAAQRIKELVAEVKLESQLITDKLIRGEIVPPIGSTVYEFYESMQLNALKIPDEILRWILGSIHPRDNGLFKMISSGSKGSNPNLIHISGAIGQAEIEGARVLENFAYRRTTPYSARYDTSPEAGGFIGRNYIDGMTLLEFIELAMNNRIDLTQKALTTAKTGYFMRRGAMANQSSVVDNLYHVSKDTKIVQFIYGEDGMDARELERVSFRTVLLSDKALDEMALPADNSAMVAPTAATVSAVAAIRADRDHFREVFIRLDSANFKKGFMTDILMPVNIRRIVESTVTTGSNVVAGLDHRIAMVADLCERLPYTFVNEIQERKRSPVSPHKISATTLMQMLVRAELNPRVLSTMTDDQLEYIIDSIRHRYANSVIDYGAAVGIIASHCIAQPLTQDMLNSHHRVGKSGDSQSGLNRITEIYSAKGIKDEQSSKMLLPLRGDVNMATAQEIANNIEYIEFRQFIRQYDIILESHEKLIYPDYINDEEWLKEFRRSHPLIKIPGDLTNWCFRFVINKSELILKAVELEVIIRKLRVKHSGIYVTHTAESVSDIVIRIWNRSTQFKREEEENAKSLLEDIMSTPIRGIEGILYSSVEKIDSMEVTEDGALIKKEKFAVVTVGTNLYNALLHPAVDNTMAISNSVGDTRMVLGIEAARAKIINETRATMADNTPNLRHLFIFADEMTRTGEVTNIERAGLGQREANNVLLRMAYGAPIQVVTDATFNNVRNKIYGIVAPQMIGSTPKIGTLYNECIVNTEFVKANTRSLDSILSAL
jgi:DNA-directed RNA polymerase beta' subunit